MNWGSRTPLSATPRLSLGIPTVAAPRRCRVMLLIAASLAACVLAQATPALSVNVLSITNAQATEGDGGAATFNVSLSRDTPGLVTVDYTTAVGPGLNPATQDVDYASVTTATTLTFPDDGTILQTIPITIFNDGLDEDDETFSVVLANPVNAIPAIDGGIGTATITDDDTTITLSGPPTVTEGSGAGTTLATYTVTATNAPASAITIDYTATAAGGAGQASAADLVAPLTGTATIPAAATTDTFTIAINRDTLDENNETFTVAISNTGGPGTVNIADSPATTTITDDDDPPTVSIGGVTVSEGSVVGTATVANFPVTLNTPSGLPVTVTLTTGALSDTATSGVSAPDYAAVVATTVTIPAGDVLVNVPVLVNQDPIYEDANPATPNPTVEAETFTATLALPVTSNALPGTLTATGTITNDDALPTISIANASAGELDAAATSTATFALSLSNPSALPITVNATTADGPAPAATASSDYAAVANQLISIPALGTTASLDVTISGDLLDEFDEQFTVTLTVPSNAVLGVAGALGTIVDNDALPTVGFVPVSTETHPEGNSGVVIPDSVKNLTLQLNVPSGRNVTVTWQTGDIPLFAPNATAGVDYVAVNPTTIVFAPGQTTKTLPVTIIGDTNAAEGSESIGLQISGEINAQILSSTKQLLILEDDVPNIAPFASADALTVNRNAPGTINVRTNDVDANGDALFVPGNTAAVHGIASCQSSGVCAYTPAPGYSGLDAFSYTISDGQATADGTVNINVVNATPIANADGLVTGQGVPGAVNVLANDTDPDGGALNIASATGGAHGAVACGAGVCNYVPAAGFIGPDQFTYTISDPDGATAVGTVNVTVAKGRPLTITAAVNGGRARRGAKKVYTITIRNPNAGPVTLTSVSVCIPKGFAYAARSVTGPLKKIPAKGRCGAGKTKLTWAKKVTIGAKRSITLRFKARVGGALTTTKVTATAKAADGFAVTPGKPSAPIKVVAK